MNCYVLLGAPGSGKWTQSKQLAKLLNIPSISTGDLLRQEVEQKTDIGIEVGRLLRLGKLVPDEIIINIFRKRIEDCKQYSGFISDGFPRTLMQAETLHNKLSKEFNLNIKTIYLEISKEVVIQRILERKNLFAGAEFQIVTTALQYCPDSVPKNVSKNCSKKL